MRKFVVAACLLGAALAGAACAGKGGAPPKETVPVTAATVETRTVPLEVQAIGHVEPLATVAVKTRIGGEITEIGFREGQDVKPGDLLFVIDPRPYEAAVQEARARLARDRALAKTARETAARYAELIKKDFVTAQQNDETEANAAAAQATVQADEASVQSAELDLSYCRITSPIAGRTGSFLVHKGNIIKANDDRTLVTINQIRPIAVTFAVPESSLAAIRNNYRSGGRLEVRAAPADQTSAAPASESGELSFLDNAVDSATGTIRLKATYANESGTLWPGQYVTVSLLLANEPGRIVVPTQAVQSSQKGSYVYVVKSDLTVETRPVTIQRTHGTYSVIAKGLSAGERVVTDGQLRLAPGSKVEIKTAAPEASS
ncbi:MAG TPA: efflux RND transporter periplasmic adaptor subunit [Thermoanaerobaculia bacterium]|nr:efflux RND transporter periplasmic adaptor subunit [Thermoanaerobaculia bacterium]